MTARAIVLDANILVRAVLGSRVSELFAAHAAQATFLAPDIAFDEAREHLPTVLAKRGKSAAAIQVALEKLQTLVHVIVPVPAESHVPFKDRALARIGPRDPDDWPGVGMCPRGRLVDLDRGHGLLRRRRRNVDHGQRRVGLHRVGSRSAGRVIARPERCGERAVEGANVENRGGLWGDSGLQDSPKQRRIEWNARQQPPLNQQLSGASGTTNQEVVGSNPASRTNKINGSHERSGGPLSFVGQRS